MQSAESIIPYSSAIVLWMHRQGVCNAHCSPFGVVSDYLIPATHLQSAPKNKNGCHRSRSVHPFFAVVWDGIEPPTQGFSVLCSTD